ncbi:MAG TPA: 2-(1,2-epoxy-1,2-dihydrophenyl)acetyl-CoA isomerase PaaG [Saprospiraceae bacterium]|nr:2-(1,2-epoxy-1,2-dihydrophenyl)acetyl-CoA isomerase PaaG [Saprospiraceae bacterium]HMQ82406.1 2-(1,2-epoxy-1,2-dihydrophenyl)acetyl-CoA isomerase PaaG [Saprospiraceae bacterium]
METILKEQIGGVLKLTLNRPQVYNSFNREMALALQAALDEAQQNPSIRAIMLTGGGKAFCAGQDLQEVVRENAPELSTILSEHYNPIIQRIRHIDLPIVAMVNGVAAGAGANIALACDVVVAAESASFIQAFSKIGLIPDSGGTFFLPRLIGFQKAAALMMLGDKIMAAEAERMGMIYACYAANELEEKALNLATQLSQMPTKALAYIKQALNSSMSNKLEEQLDLEDRLQTAAGQTADYQEGVQAFLEKRTPVFKGQ